MLDGDASQRRIPPRSPCLEANSARTMNQELVIRTKVLSAVIGTASRSAGLGQPLAADRSTMYAPIRPLKNITSVARKSQMANFPRSTGGPLS